MQEIIKKLEENNLLEKSEGAWIVNLEDEGLGKALIKKSDGTSLYTTRDLAAAINRKEKYDFDKLIYEVGSEQQLHFKQLFKIIEKLGYSWGKECYHVSHGLYLGEDGKKFSTRKGKTIYMKDILDEAYEKAKQSLNNRENLPEEEIEKRAEKISKAAIFYGDLKNFRENNIVFNIDRFLEFEGNTGPYLLYSYARASSIIEKSKIKQSTYPDSLEEAEIKLVKKLEAFPEITKKAYENFSPNIIANYSYELSQVFNEFYHSCPVIGSNSEKLRIDLVESFRQVLKNSLNLLGIEPLEKM